MARIGIDPIADGNGLLHHAPLVDMDRQVVGDRLRPRHRVSYEHTSGYQGVDVGLGVSQNNECLSLPNRSWSGGGLCDPLQVSSE